jgi:protoporphyrinogen oxidase
MRKMRVGILGGGLAGLTAASLLKHDFEVLEKNAECGGLCRSLQEDGFTFDYGGGHIIFSRDKKIMDFMVKKLGSNVLKRKRNTKVFFKGRYVKYPFENGLSDLSGQDNFNCLYSYLKVWLARERGELREPRNFMEWMYNTFGDGIAEEYLIPYNRKIWNIEPSRMSVDWVKDRIPQPPPEDVVKSSLGLQTEGYTHQLHFYYPRLGGIQAIINRFEQEVKDKITSDFEVKRVKKEGKSWVVSDGKREKVFDKVISTIPVMELADAYGGTSAEARRASKALKYNSLVTVLLGYNISRINDIHWLYFPRDDEGMFNKVSFVFNHSPYVVPKGKSSAIAEITCRPGDEIWRMKDKKLIDHVINKFDEHKIASGKKVCFAKVMRSDYAYVINDMGYSRNTRICREFFAEEGIVLCGRFAEFKYLNMDATVKSAMEKAEALNRVAK